MVHLDPGLSAACDILRYTSRYHDFGVGVAGEGPETEACERLVGELECGFGFGRSACWPLNSGSPRPMVVP